MASPRVSRSPLDRLAQGLWRPSDSRVVLHTELSPQRLLARLQSALSDEAPEITGRIQGTAIQLWRRASRSHSRGTFAPVFYGAVEPTPDGGSRLVGHFQLHPVTRLYILVWTTASVLLALGFLGVGILRASPEQDALDALPFVWPALLPLAGLAVVRWQQRRGRADEEAVRTWLGTIMGTE